MRKVQEILKMFGVLNGSEIGIKSKSLNFSMLFLKTQLLHLLGVHYIHSDFRKIKGRELLREILHKDYSDEEIYERINKNNPEQLDNVKNRIHYFKEFMYNLDNAKIVEMTNPTTKIKSHHLILQSADEKYLQLGIAKGEMADYLETFLVSANDFYFSDSEINEEVTGIYRYDEECNLIPFSFDPVKAEKLEREYNEQKDKEDEQRENSEMDDSFNVTGADEDEWDNEI